MRWPLAGALAALLLPVSTAGAGVTTFGYGNARTASTAARAIAPAGAARLRVAWRARVGGAVSDQVLVVDRIRAGGRRRTLVLVGDEGGWVTALDARDGARVWRRQLGTRRIDPDCGAAPDDHFGVTSTMVADRGRGTLYAVDARGRAWALDLGSGRPRPGWPVTVHHATGGEFVWSALSLSHGRLYVPIASLCDQGGRYRGGMVSVDQTTRALRRWQTTAGTGAYAGGVWAWGGASIDGAGDLFVATGNSYGTLGETEGYAERVVRLSAGLVPRASDLPTVPPFETTDRDFGSTPAFVDAPGCPPQLVVLSKTGELFLYDRDAIAAGPVQRLRVARPDGVPLIGDAAYDPVTRTVVLTTPSTPPDGPFHAGILALRLDGTCRLVTRWNRTWTTDSGSAPTISGGVVWITTGRLGGVGGYALADGRPVFAKSLSDLGAMAAPIVSGRTLYASDWAGHVWAFRPR